MNRIAALAIVVLALVAWALFERQGRVSAVADADHLRTELSASKAALAQAAEAAAVHRAYLAKAQDEARKWADIENEFRDMEGRDAPLSPLLRAAAERLWGQN